MLTLGYKIGSGNQHILVTKFQEFMPAKPMGTAEWVKYFRRIYPTDRF